MFLQAGASLGKTFGDGKFKVSGSIDPNLRYQSFIQRTAANGTYGTYFDNSLQTGLELHGGIQVGHAVLDVFGGGGVSPASLLNGNFYYLYDATVFHLGAGAQVGWIF